MRYSNSSKDKNNNILDKIPHLILNDLHYISNIFSSYGHQVRIVGGSVRDLLLDQIPKDFDLATTATPEEIIQIAKDHKIKFIPTGIEHGTVTYYIKGNNYEITTLRIDKKTDGRHAQVEFTTNWKEDARRRDLTINALSLDLDGNLYDYFNGIEDLKHGKTRFVGDAEERITEDYLRILRIFRFYGRSTNPHMDQETKDAIKKHASGLKKISGERIWMEMSKILSGNHTKEILQLMDALDVIHNIGMTSLNLSNLEFVKKNTKNPATILCCTLSSQDEVNRIVSHWKLSTVERDLMSFIIRNRDKSFDLDIAKEMWVTVRQNKCHVLELARYFGRHDIVDFLQSWNPIFPITGNDLIDLGFKPGPDLGKILSDLKQKWIKSDYTLSKENLLSNF